MPNFQKFVNDFSKIMQESDSCEQFSEMRVVLVAGFSSTLYADDGAASIAAGGIVVMKHEPRIVMAKEVLNISPKKVVVDYDFRNDSDENVTTEVAFPVPPYENGPNDLFSRTAGFEDFKLSIEEKPVSYEIESRAFIGKNDITALLHSLHVDVASFGNQICTQTCTDSADVKRLSKQQREKLLAAKAINGDLSPDWKVEKKYHWTQTFPAHKLVHIRHEYTPVVGNSNTALGDPELATLCPTPALQHTIEQVGTSDTDPTGLFYVDFILTTADTWKTPIEDFTLNVERENPLDYKINYVSFCWDGPVTKIDANHFSTHLTGLIPKKELRIGFVRSDYSYQQMKENRAWEIAHPSPAKH